MREYAIKRTGFSCTFIIDLLRSTLARTLYFITFSSWRIKKEQEESRRLVIEQCIVILQLRVLVATTQLSLSYAVCQCCTLIHYPGTSGFAEIKSWYAASTYCRFRV